MLVAQVAQVGIGFVDTVMAGGAGKDDLAAVALGSSVFATIYITFMGVMTALNLDDCPAFGAGKADEVGETGRQGIWFGVMLGIIGMLLMWLLVWPFQAWLSLSDKVENMMALYMFFTGLAMPAAMVHRALHAWCFEPEPAAGDYDCELFGVFAEYSTQLCLCLRQIRHAGAGRCGPRRGHGGCVLV